MTQPTHAFTKTHTRLHTHMPVQTKPPGSLLLLFALPAPICPMVDLAQASSCFILHAIPFCFMASHAIVLEKSLMWPFLITWLNSLGRFALPVVDQVRQPALVSRSHISSQPYAPFQVNQHSLLHLTIPYYRPITLSSS